MIVYLANKTQYRAEQHGKGAQASCLFLEDEHATDAKATGRMPIQDIATLNLSASRGVAVREMQSHGGPADYILFVDGMPKSEVQRITFEIAMLGTRGLQVNDPAEQYSLNSISGKFSGLHLLCIEYVGFQIIDPKVDIGFDLSAEYEAACKMHGKP